SKLLLELGADVDDERRLLEVLTKAHAVNHFERTVPRLVGGDLRQAGDEAGITHQLRGDAMVRMATLASGWDDDARLVSTDGVGHDRARLRRVDDPRVRQAEVLARGELHDLGRAVGFLLPRRGVTARAHLSLREIDDGGRVALFRRLDQRPRAGELDVVPMRRDGEQVHWHAQNITAY